MLGFDIPRSCLTCRWWIYTVGVFGRCMQPSMFPAGHTRMYDSSCLKYEKIVPEQERMEKLEEAGLYRISSEKEEEKTKEGKKDNGTVS